MPAKVCTICSAEFFARWRNTPNICEDCALRATVCPCCWRVELRADDPRQLALFSSREMETAGVWWSVAALLAHHFTNRPPATLGDVAPAPWPRSATQAERLRYPFH